MQHAFIEAAMTQLPSQHGLRLSLHNEVHARPPEPMGMPMVLSHVVMACNGGQRDASRAHMAALARDHHLPAPEESSIHMRMDFGSFKVRWELHTEFVTWTFMRSIAAQGGTERDPEVALDAVPQQWFAELPGECLACLHLWVLPAKEETVMPWLRHVLHEETLVASTVADGLGEVYTDFSVHADGFSRMVLLAGGMTPRRLGRLVQCLLEIETYRMAALLGLPAAREASHVLASAERELAELEPTNRK